MFYNIFKFSWKEKNVAFILADPYIYMIVTYLYNLPAQHVQRYAKTFFLWVSYKISLFHVLNYSKTDRWISRSILRNHKKDFCGLFSEKRPWRVWMLHNLIIYIFLWYFQFKIIKFCSRQVKENLKIYKSIIFQNYQLYAVRNFCQDFQKYELELYTIII